MNADAKDRIESMRKLTKFLQVVLFIVRVVLIPLVCAPAIAEVLALFYISLSGHTLSPRNDFRAMLPWERILAFGVGCGLCLLLWAVWRYLFFPKFLRLQIAPRGDQPPPPGWPPGSAGGTIAPLPPGGRTPVLTGEAALPLPSKF